MVVFREILYICKILVCFILTIQGFLINLKTVETFDVMCTFNVGKCKKIKNFKSKKMRLVIKSDNTNWEIVEVQIN